MRNPILQDARELLNQRYHLNSRDPGALSEYHRRCAIQLLRVVAELDSTLCYTLVLEHQVKELQATIAKEKQ